MEAKRLFLLDADDLLKAWEEAGSTSFSTFRDLWQQKAFSFIHEGRPKDLDRKEFLQTLFTAAFEYLQGANNSLPLKIGALYLNYMLYETQPGSYKQRVRIYTSPEDLKALHALMTEAHQNRLVDAALVANRMMQSGALLFGAVHSRLDADALKGPAAIVRKARDRLLPTEILEEHFETSVGDLLPLTKVDHDAREYNKARKQLVAAKRGPLAETDEPPYITLAEDLLRKSAALERHVRIALQASDSSAAPLRRGARHPRRTADVSKRLAPAADVSLAAGGASADVSGTAAPAADVIRGAGEAEEAEAEPVPDFIAELAPLPVQSMPSISGFVSEASEPMEAEPPASPAEEEIGSDEELARELEEALEADVMEHDQPESADVESPDLVAPSPEENAMENGRPSECGETERDSDGTSRAVNGLNGHLENGHGGRSGRGEGAGRHLEEGGEAENGVLDRRWNGQVSSEDSDSDDDLDIRRPLPRALSPLL